MNYENTSTEYDASAAAPEGPASENGEYRYKYAAGRAGYDDAHYEPAGNTAEPKKYYVPPKKDEPSEGERSGGKKKGTAGKIIAAVLLCAVFSAAGGVAGAFYTEKRFSEEIASLRETAAYEAAEENAATEEAAVETEDRTVLETAASVPAAKTISRADIYNAACSQVVGVTTEVTYTNFFGMTSSSAVSGTGLIYSDSGYVLTNYHVIEYAAKYGCSITAILYDGTELEAVLVGAEEDNDLAVLKIAEGDYTAARMGDSEKIQVGDYAYAVGNPLGELEFTMTSGTVSALDRLISSEESGTPINMFQIDAAVNTGNSGGPVYNANGEVIGIVTAKYSSNGVEGIGFAIPSNDAVRIADELIAHGYVTGKAYLGISYDENKTSVYNYYYRDLWGAPRGVLVLSVVKGSCAEKAGITEYDTITAVGEYTVENCSDLTAALKNYSAGDTVPVTIYRTGGGHSAGRSITLNITLDEAVPRNLRTNMSTA